ncbi:MAG: flavin-dependent oxidoreductase, F420-dependent methylene-tetrahydromethanopterin reductase [Acidimicrobiales bacterium]|nr:flavin-dependent oxidoreductase, F420-dependent methylene-tetrahydromethanopterin reductase [Acidimicrobiales bacterium]
MKLGVTLPQFRDEPEPALAVARRAEAAGLDGVFVFDHLWPLHEPERPALHSLTLLGALVAETDRITLATFVARVSLLPDAVLVHTLFGLHRMCEGRFIAGLGTGDRENRDENIAYGVGFPPAAARARQLVDCCRRLRELDVRTWVGGDSPTARGIAANEADGWNGWGLSPDEFASLAAEVKAESGERVDVTWGGQVLVGRTEEQAREKWERHGTRPGLVHGTVEDLRRHLSALKAAGAAWAICSPLDIGTDDEAVDLLAEARP